MAVVCSALDCWSVPWRPRGLDEAPKSSITSGVFAPQHCSTQWWSGEDDATLGNGWGFWVKCPSGCMSGWWWWTYAPPLCHHHGVPVRGSPWVVMLCVQLPWCWEVRGLQRWVRELSRQHQQKGAAKWPKPVWFAWGQGSIQEPCIQQIFHLKTVREFF